ncbi:MAG: hypothetical protein FWG68_10960 [Defluviitaleaceae bacterium]|nr:hypothetical protein [Defluviitaleaceae bacterium]
MSIIDKCCDKVFGVTAKRFDFNIESYYPLFLVNKAFSLVDRDGLLGLLLDRYCGNYRVINGIKNIKTNVVAAKRDIKADLLPLTNIKLNYCLTLYYSELSPAAELDITNALNYLCNIERDVSYSTDYKVSVIIVVDSQLASDNPTLKDFLAHIQQLNFDIYAFTCDYGYDGADIVQENHMALIGSIVAAVVLRSNALSAKLCNEDEQNSRTDIQYATSSMNLHEKTKLSWQSVSAIFSDKRRDFVAYALNTLFSNIEPLSTEKVVNEASKIDTPLGNTRFLQEILSETVTAIPTIVAKPKIKYPKTFSFNEACKLMFGSEGYRVAEISCKITFANCLKTTENDYIQRAEELVAKVSAYRHDNLMDTIIKGVDIFIKQLQDEINDAEVTYQNFIDQPFDATEFELADILAGYVLRFLKREELSTKLDYWQALKTKFSPAMIPEYSKLVRHVATFNELKKTLHTYQYSYNFDVQLPNLNGYTMKTALELADNDDFLATLAEMSNKYVNSATEIGFAPNWSFALAFLPQPAVSRKVPVSKDFGGFQIKGSQLFSEYWEFQ